MAETNTKNKGGSRHGGMLQRFALWVKLFLFPLFSRTQVVPDWKETISELEGRARVVHVLQVRSTMDGLLLNFHLLRNRLGLAVASNGFPFYWMRSPIYLLLYPLLRLLRLAPRGTATPRELAECVERREPVMLFLKRGRLMFIPGQAIGTPYLTELVALQRRLNEPIVFVPHILFWGSRVERFQKNIFDLVFGHPSAPGIRRFLAYIRNVGLARMILARPLALDELLARYPEEVDDGEVASKARWMLHQEMNRELKVARGPIQKGALKAREEILSNPEFDARLTELAPVMKISRTEAQRRARKYLKEIGADMRESYIEGLSAILTPLFNRVFGGIVLDRDLLETIREASRETPVVLVPCHRSHMDYLLLSYLLYFHGIIPPHIVAGANLSFFPMGLIFRRCGAFFMRRSFKDNPIYAHSFSSYIRKLIKDGHSIEFFIEGGRSRTGKVLPPRFGILGNIVDAVLTRGAKEVTIIPVALTYDRIIEANSYLAEISGEDKQAENAAQVVRSAQVLDRRYGTVYISGGRPLSIRAYADRLFGEDKDLDEQDRRYLVTRLGYHILGRINQAGVITPSALAATVLLSHLRRGISVSRFRFLAGFLIQFARDRGYSISLTLDRALRAHAMELARAEEEARAEGTRDPLDLARGTAVWQVLEESLENLKAEKHIRILEHGGEKIFSINEGHRIYIDYFRNNIIHVFQREAFIATTLLAREFQGQVPFQTLIADLRFLSSMMKREFIFRVGDMEEGVFEGLRTLESIGTVKLEQDNVRIRPEGEDRLILFRNMIVAILESYLLCTTHLSVLRWKGAQSRKDLIRKIMDRARRQYHEGDISCQESISQVSISNAIDAFLDQGILTIIEAGIDKGKIRFSTGSAELELSGHKKKLEFLLRRTGQPTFR